MLKRLLLTTLLTLLLASACTRFASSPPPTALPLNFPTPEPGSMPRCQPTELKISSNSTTESGALRLGITLTNQSANPCALTNPPQVALLNDKGQPLEAQISATTDDQTLNHLVLAPGESAILSLIWQNYCQPLPNDSLTLSLELDPQQKLEVVTHLLTVPDCEAKNKPSQVTISPYSYPP